ncbi:alpha/beta hydrolase-fold protein [uncultured Gemmiger sp.]|uniref:carboxylesterase family protein n=1 Tax=uncultured Gemmiger sp. TaxID=1623490 RepID=UPI0025CCA043|nr:alpha/beta hydrolase-fold protein [uncultured Gemmiger sp.]
MKLKMYHMNVLSIAAVLAVGLLCGCNANTERVVDADSEVQKAASSSVAVQSEISISAESISEENTTESDPDSVPAEPETESQQEPSLPQSSESPASFNACSINTTQMGNLSYWLYIPSNPTEDMPLIVYLHGGSEKGDDLELVTAADGFPQYLQNGELGDVRSYVIIPQLPSSEKSWESISDAICELIDTTAETYAIDRNNISLTGHSMGGTGVWHLACMYPTLFARIAPLSGSIRCTPETLSKLKNAHIWAFVGSADSIVAPEASEKIVAALKNAGSDAEITVFDEADHFSVPRLAYLDANVGLMNWLIGN